MPILRTTWIEFEYFTLKDDFNQDARSCVEKFAILSTGIHKSRLTCRLIKSSEIVRKIGAGDEIRTHDPNLGKVMLYP